MDEWLQMIADCEARESRLLEWESMFVDSISKQLATKGYLTGPQSEKLEEIWNRATKRG